MRPDLKLLGFLLIFLGILQFAAGFITQEHINSLNAFYLPKECSPSGSACPILSTNVELHVAFSWLNAIAEISMGGWLAFLRNEKKQPSRPDSAASKITRMEGREAASKLEIFLKGLGSGEKKIMREVYSRGQVSQSRLHEITPFSKAKISLILSRLERRGLIKKEPRGKTNIIAPTQNF